MRRAQNLSSYILRHHRHLQTTAALLPSSAASTTDAVLTVDHWRWSAVNAVAFYSTRSRSPNLDDSNRSFSTLAAGAASASFAASFIAGSAAAKEIPKPDFLPENVVLYQYEACPFCNKVKAFLDYHDIAYKVVEVNPLSKKEIKWSDYKKVPILTVDGETLVDSSDIINKLHTRMHHDDGGVDIDSEESKSEENDWRRWVDNHLVHVLSPNIYRNKNEALEAFNYITEHGNFSSTERFAVKYAGAAAMYFVSKKLKKKYNITDERKALYDAAEIWVGALNGRDFLGGSKPNLADLAVFGVLRPIRHLSAGRDMVEHTQVGEWYDRMEKAVGPSSRIQV